MIAKIKGKRYRYVPLLMLSVSVGLLGVGAFAFVRGILSGGPPPSKKVAQEIHVIRPPPPPDVPPPPPPPPEEKVDVPDPQKQEPDPTPSNEPPPSEQLGLDAEGTAGGDAFGLLGNKGGRELIGTGGGSVFTWYLGLAKADIQEQLSENPELRKGNYKATVQIWIRSDGGVDRARVVKSSGDPKRDRSIVDALQGSRISKPPPPDFPQSMTFEMDGHG